MHAPEIEPIELVNLTGHPIRLLLSGGHVMEILPSGRVALLIAPAPDRRVCRIRREGAVPVEIEVLVEPTVPRGVALPAPRAGVAFIVSSRIAEACPDRDDLLAPATGPGEGAVRDGRGCVVAVSRFKRFQRCRGRKA